MFVWALIGKETNYKERKQKKWSTIIDFEIFNNVVSAFNYVDILS